MSRKDKISGKYVENPSYAGASTRNLHLYQEGAEVLAVLFPGMAYSCEAPLLHYARSAVLEAGCSVLCLEYGFQTARTDYSPEREDAVIAKEAANLIRTAFAESGCRKLLFIGKSIGTRILDLTERVLRSEAGGDEAAALPHISRVYMTPLESRIPALLQSSGLVLAGTEDPMFPSERLDELRVNPQLDIRLFEGANHSLEVEDDWRRSLEYVANR